MKKVLLAFESDRFSEGAFEYARRLNEMEPILLVGVFMPLLNISSLWSYADGYVGDKFIPLLEKETTVQVHQNISRFERLCVNNEIAFRVHKEFDDLALEALNKESRFADLLILSSEKFYANIYEGQVNPQLQDALIGAECSVIVVPENFVFPERNVLAYDGSESSVYAIKQFAYLFPGMCANETLLVHISSKTESEIPDREYVQELTTRHFRNLTIFKLDFNPAKYFGLWASEKKGSIIVSGSYGRSFLSRMFRRSFVSEVVGKHKLPVFVAHRR